jgi:AcrR family transcriptional regulator
MPTPRRSGRIGRSRTGRPRDERIDSEVVAAVLRTLTTHGYRAVTIDGIARKVGRARTSLYRRWPSKRHLVAYAVLSEMGDPPASHSGELRRDLEAAVRTLFNAFAGPLGPALAGLVADMAHDEGLARAIRRDVLAERREWLRRVFDRARARGEAREDLDIELVLDMLTGPFYYRMLFGHQRITPRMMQELVEYVLRAVCPRRQVRRQRGSPRRVLGST